MKHLLYNFIILYAIIFSSCANDANKKDSSLDSRDRFKIGEREWLIELPKNYVSYASMPETIEHNNICGKLSKPSNYLSYKKKIPFGKIHCRIVFMCL
jgi:hypothetical protein